MLYKLCTITLLGTLLAPLQSLADTAFGFEGLTFITEQNPPLNFSSDGRFQGVAPELLALVWKELGQQSLTITSTPWARGYQYLLKKPGTCLFSTTKTAQRESLGIKWAGPVNSNPIVLLARRGAHVRIERPEDLHKLAIGTINKDVGEQLVINNGVPKQQLTRTNSLASLLQILNLKRVDVIAKGQSSLIDAIEQQGLEQTDYEVVYTLKQSQQYFAFHKDTPDRIVNQFQHAIDKLKPEHLAILRKYKLNPL